MDEVYHIKIKKEYAAAVIEDLIKSDAVEDIESALTDLPQWQKDAINKELAAIEENQDYTIAWDQVKHRFIKP